MFGKTRYLEWAWRFYGSAKLDLASSGIPDADITLAAPPNLHDRDGVERLRAAIATHNNRPIEEVVPCLGTSQGIFLAYSATCNPGDEILVEAPGYEPLTRTAEGVGAVVRTFERPEKEGFRVLPERVAAAITPKTRLIAVTTLHNPSGVRIDDATLIELAKIAEARGAHLLVDEVYAPFDDLATGHTARSLAPNIIAISSLTKCYGLGNARVGWLLGPKEIVENARAAVLATCGHFPLSHANVAVSAFAELPALAARAKVGLAEKRALAETFARSVGRWSEPKEGLFGFCGLEGRGDLRPAIEKLVTEHGVLVGAGTFFGAPEGFRLSWARTELSQFAEGLALLKRHLC